jgi:hypothetical protein
MSFPAHAIERLATKVLTGDVVFFIGSGCSYDSEGNTGTRLLRRLVWRVLALSNALGALGKSVRDDLVRTMGLAGATDEDLLSDWNNLDKLGKRYFEANDWFCEAFAYLLKLASDGDRAAILKRAQQHEAALFKIVRASSNESIGLDPIDPGLLDLVQKADTSAGKALFLDSMGFRNRRIMHGEPEADSITEVETSYEGRLLPRHHVFARLAREGLCGTLITTNFDLLLEGAYRLSGFRDNNSAPAFPPTLMSKFDVITSRTDFFTKAKAYRTAVVVKMHGCAARYTTTNYTNVTILRDRLRSMVFTYREIQNWREDRWAADYLRTLLRTRVVVFCGYSVADPVVHDTFRTVYEEMARARAASPAPPPAIPRPDDNETCAPACAAPTFFMAVKDAQNDSQEFHGMAILQAASEAIGVPRSEFGQHPNYVHFHRRDREEFPNFDELMRWLYHLTLRGRQTECLLSDLRRISTNLLNKPRPEAELEGIRSAFAKRFQTEKIAARGWTEKAVHRHAFGALCGWSDLFHPGLLREFAYSDVARQQRATARDLSAMRNCAWYYPAMEDSGWTCWGAVLELALHRMAERTGAALCVAHSSQPAIWVQQPAAQRITPHLLTIRSKGFERPGLRSRVLGNPSSSMIWELDHNDAPWPRVGAAAEEVRLRAGARRERRAPTADLIWRWAAGAETDADLQDLPNYFGLPQAP